MLLHPDRLLPAEPAIRAIARDLYQGVAGLPIVSPHGHTEARWYAENRPFANPAELIIVPDHYIFRLLYSQGVALEDLGIPTRDGTPVESDPRAIWQRFAAHYHLFRGTPTRAWLDHTFATLFGFDEVLGAGNADAAYDAIDAALRRPEFLPRALIERFNVEVIATTDGPLDDLRHHATLKASGWRGRVVPTYRPDAVTDPDFEGFAANIARLGEVAGTDVGSYAGYLEAHRRRRAFFKAHGATATDHGHPSALTADLPRSEAEALYRRVTGGNASAADRELFRAQMLTEMAAMSLDDDLVMQIHAGAIRNHNPALFARFGRNVGADIPARGNFVGALKPLLDRFGNEAALTVILFTLDETTYARELAPLAGHYPALRLGPPWWFYDAPHGMRRFREAVTETAGFYNTVGFNDDTRALLSIPARHDMARRMDCGYLAELVATHRLGVDEARELAHELAYGLAKRAYKL